MSAQSTVRASTLKDIVETLEIQTRLGGVREKMATALLAVIPMLEQMKKTQREDGPAAKALDAIHEAFR